MNLRTRLIICLLLFAAAFIIRWGSSLDVQDKPGRQTPTYQTLGTGGDPDYQLYCARELSSGGSGGTEVWTHYDYFFLCPAMSLVIKHFSLIASFQIFTFTGMVFGSLAVVMPFAVFSTLKRYDLGGLLASLILLVNPVMINNSDGRFYNYPLVVFFFTLFSVAYIMALYRKTLFWLVLLGVVAVIQGISKPFLYVNDMVLMLVFPLLICLQSWRFTNHFPFLKLTFDWRHLRRATFPTQIYYIGIVGFEIIHRYATVSSNGFFYLSDLFLPMGVSTKDAVLGVSLHFDGGILQKTKNILSLGIVALNTLIAYIPQAWTVLILAAGSIVLRAKKPLLWLIASVVAVKALSYILLFITNSLLYPNIYVPLERLSVEVSMTAALFAWFLALLAIHTKKGLLFITMHIFYLAALAMALAAVRQPQLFVTLIIWFALMIGYSANTHWPRFIRNMSSRVHFFLMAVLLLLFLSPINEVVGAARKNWENTQKEKAYLAWVSTNIPDNAIILGGIDDNLPLISQTTNRTIIYNAKYVAHFITPGAKIHDLYQKPGDLSLYLRDQIASPTGVPLYFLDNSPDAWQALMETGSTGNYPANWFRLEEVASNADLNRRVYRLVQGPAFPAIVE